MQQTKPLFLIRKYHSILTAAAIVESVNYIVSLTDSIVAGSILGSDALVAIGMITPLMTFTFFIASIIISGTVKNYSYQIGRFDKRRAAEFFSDGFWMALIVGAVYAGLLMIVRDPVLSFISPDGAILEYEKKYFNIIVIFYFLTPLALLLDNMVIIDGDEKLSAAANIVMIVSNVAFSFLFAFRWGITGVALASVLSKLLFIGIICFHFKAKTNTLRLVRFLKAVDIPVIVKSGISKASTYATESLCFFVLNVFVMYWFPDDTLSLLVLAEKLLGLMTLYIGISMAAQPLIGTLRGENNISALRSLMKTVFTDVTAAGAILTLLTMISAPLIMVLFGVSAEPLRTNGIAALRIVGSTLIPHAILVQFFIYLYLMDREMQAFLVGLLKNLIMPVSAAIVMSFLTNNPVGLWIGLALSPVVSLIIIAAWIFAYCGKKNLEFPFLLPKDKERKTFIYDFDLTPENIVEMSKEADRLTKDLSVSPRTEMFAGMFIEEIFMLILEKNKGRGTVRAECTVIAEKEGLRLILRDSGVIFRITDENAVPDSFRQYVVANMMTVQENKTYLTTTGYNRCELFFPE